MVRGEGREELAGNRVPFDGTISGWVARHLEPLVLEGDLNDPRFNSTHPSPEDLTAVSMPMVLGSNLIGVINVNRKRHSPN
jgi:hypothetical protein